MTPKLFNNKKGNLAATMLILVVLFNIGMYLFIYYANQDSSINISSNYAEFDEELSDTAVASDSVVQSTQIISWYSGFKISIFGLPKWMDIFYITFQSFLVVLSIFMLIRGND